MEIYFGNVQCKMVNSLSELSFARTSFRVFGFYLRNHKTQFIQKLQIF